MNLLALDTLAEGVLLFVVGLMFGVAVRRALVPFFLVWVGLALVGYLQLSFPVNAVAVLSNFQEDTFRAILGIQGVEWVCVVGVAVGFTVAHCSHRNSGTTLGGLTNEAQ